MAAPKRVLVVEDDPALAELYKQGIAIERGHELVVVETAEEGLERYLESTFDLVIVDYRLPRMNGLELIAAIRELDKATPIIICTGYRDDEVDEIGRQLGVFEVFSKPFYIMDFRESVNNVLAQPRLGAKPVASQPNLVQLGEAIGPIPEWPTEKLGQQREIEDRLAEVRVSKASLRDDSGLLLSALFHELSNAIVSMLSDVRLAKLDKGIGKDLEMIEFRANRAIKILQQLRDFPIPMQLLVTDVLEVASPMDTQASGAENANAEVEPSKVSVEHGTSIFLRAILHELSNTVVPVPGLVKLVRESGDSQKYLDMIESKLYQSVAIFPRLRTFPVSLSLQATDTLEVIASSQRRISVPEDIYIAFDVPEEARVVESNSQVLLVVFTNLMLNAIHAMKESSSKLLVVENRLVDNEWVEIRVSDTGCGMSNEIQAKLFEPAFTTRKEEGGLGLGLWLSEQLIERLGGTLVLEKSKPGEGSTFLVKLPVSGTREEP